MTAAIFLLLLGFGLVAAEVFFPSFGVLSILAGAALIGSVVLAFQESSGAGWTFLVVIGVCLPALVVLAFRVFPRTPLGRRMLASGVDWTPEERAAVDRSARGLVGRHGQALSPLRPAGIAEIDGERVDVVTRGEHLQAGTPVEVIQTVGNRIIVQQAATEDAP